MVINLYYYYYDDDDDDDDDDNGENIEFQKTFVNIFTLLLQNTVTTHVGTKLPGPVFLSQTVSHNFYCCSPNSIEANFVFMQVTKLSNKQSRSITWCT